MWNISIWQRFVVYYTEYEIKTAFQSRLKTLKIDNVGCLKDPSVFLDIIKPVVLKKI